MDRRSATDILGPQPADPADPNDDQDPDAWRDHHTGR